MPEPFSLSIGLTVIAIALAAAFAPQGNFNSVVTSWFTGMFGILAFALQMILILATGFAIADAPLVKKGLSALASTVTTPTRRPP